MTAVTQERDVYGFNWAPDAKLLVNDGENFCASRRAEVMRRCC